MTKDSASRGDLPEHRHEASVDGRALYHRPARRCQPKALLPLVLACALLPARARAEGAPLGARNLAPQYLFLLHPTPDTPWVLPQGRSGAGLDLAYASIYVRDPGSETRALLDMEVARADLRYSRGFGRFQAGFDLPVLWMGAGSFDHVVDGFHETFHLPTGGRKTAPRDRFAYEVQRGSERFEPDANGEFGLGDLTLEAKTALAGTRALAGRAAVKLPTGSRAKGFGSGRADASLGLLAEVGAGPLRFWGNVDGVYVGGTPDSALHLGTHWALAAGGTVSASLGSLVDVELELQYLTSPYSTGLETLDRDVLLLAFGLARNFGGVRVSLGFTEDLATGASPDFALFLNFRGVPSASSRP